MIKINKKINKINNYNQTHKLIIVTKINKRKTQSNHHKRTNNKNYHKNKIK